MANRCIYKKTDGKLALVKRQQKQLEARKERCKPTRLGELQGVRGQALDRCRKYE